MAILSIFLLFVAVYFNNNVSCNNILLQEVEGIVGSENYTYYRLAYGGNLLLELESVYGDADIYINNKNVMPTYNPETYDFHSATCGDDSVLISKTYKRPISVGIFGHPSHELSTFLLRVYQTPYEESYVNYEYEYMEEHQPVANENSDAESVTKSVNFNDNNKQEPNNVQSTRIKRKVRSLTTKTGIWAFLEIFELLFL